MVVRRVYFTKKQLPHRFGAGAEIFVLSDNLCTVLFISRRNDEHTVRFRQS